MREDLTLELAATRKGTFPNFAKGHLDGRRSPRRGQNRRIRTPARDVVSDLRDARVCSEGLWPRLDMVLAVVRTVPRRPTGRPLVARAVIAWHREAAALETAKKQLVTPIGKATPMIKSLHLYDDDSLQKQIRAVVKQAVQVKQQEQGSKGAKAKDDGASWAVIFMMLAELVLATRHGSPATSK